MPLFDHSHVIGVFRGFAESGLEFHADLVLPHSDALQNMAMHGQFVLVQLEQDREALLGRITSISSYGRLVSPVGEDYATRAVRDQRAIPDELRERYLKYKVDIRVLGVLRHDGAGYEFVPSHRRLPQVGAQVATLSDELLHEVTSAYPPGRIPPGSTPIGFLALGEYVYSGDDPRAGDASWIVPKYPTVMPTFEIDKLVARRSFVFARAGFGKSNLVKLLFSELYRGRPTVPRRGGARAPVGTVIFDPDGEYFWPSPQGNPGLCDVEHLQDRLVVFTNRSHSDPYYQGFAVDGVKLNIKDLPPARVLSIALSPEKQDQQNVAKLKSLSASRWAELVDLVHAEGYRADVEEAGKIIGFRDGEDVQAMAAVNNMARVVRALHDPQSQLLRALKYSLSEGRLCVVDISQMRGLQGLHLAGIILDDIFEHNQREFTEPEPKTIPTIAVVEEAQSVLDSSGNSDDGPFTSWVKEGRKYDLGAMLITQQPGSIPGELLSQGDNFFVFHLLSAGDLTALKRANAHFSDDLLATILNEPLVGHGVFWSSAPGADQRTRPYPIPIRVLPFDTTHRPRNPADRGETADNFATATRERLREELARAEQRTRSQSGGGVAWRDDGAEGAPPRDASQTFRNAAIHALGEKPEFRAQVESAEGIMWGKIIGMLKEYAPTGEDDPAAWAHRIVGAAMDFYYGPEGWGSERRPNPRTGKATSWVFLTDLPRPQEPDAPAPGSLSNDEPPF